MSFKSFLSCLLGLCFIIGCNSDNGLKQFSLKELETNFDNQLELALKPNPDLKKICEELSTLEKETLEKQLQKKGVDLIEVAYGFHFLGNRCFEKNDFDLGLHYQEIAAEVYLNPFANLRLARMYSFPNDKIKTKLPDGQGKDFKQDLNKSFLYLNNAINYAILSNSYLKDNYTIATINKIGGPLIDAFEKKDSSIVGHINIDSLTTVVQSRLPQLENHFKQLYGQSAKVQ